MKKKRDEMKMIWRVSPAHKKLQERMKHIREFRRQHEQLRSFIERVRRLDQQTMVDVNANEVRFIMECFTMFYQMLHYVLWNVLDALSELTCDISFKFQEVSNAYALVEEVEVLEISKEGQEAWDAAVRRYNERVDTVEAQITAALREQLATAKSANEMFRIFARYVIR